MSWPNTTRVPSLVSLFVSSRLLFPGVDVGTRFEAFLPANCGADPSIAVVPRLLAVQGFAAQSKARASCSSFLRLATLFTLVMVAGAGPRGGKCPRSSSGSLLLLPIDIMLAQLQNSNSIISSGLESFKQFNAIQFEDTFPFPGAWQRNLFADLLEQI